MGNCGGGGVEAGVWREPEKVEVAAISLDMTVAEADDDDDDEDDKWEVVVNKGAAVDEMVLLLLGEGLTRFLNESL